MSRIISYKGLMADSSQDTIILHTNDGKTGYKIVKFELMSNNPAAVDQESVVQIWTVEQTGTPSLLINFSDVTLLAAGFMEGGGTHTALTNETVVFDNVVFNQDIYITHQDQQGGLCNYYLELEQVSLTEDQALVAIVKNLRNEQ
jgi:hypothetical protein